MEFNNGVSIREEIVSIPTYKVGTPEKSPVFIEKRAYQGSTGKVYPLPVIEKISDQKEELSYKALILENEFIEIMILPELGGRIQRAYDKTNGYDFVYYNHVIKPALVGLAGPWISGGIEFNWPQHHRPTTFSPVDYSYKTNEDGSCTAFVGETDPINGTKGMAKITVYPHKSYIEIKGQLYNSTDFPQTFLWWANPAVPVNDHTYSVFPPDVNAVMDHGKRSVSTFPIATGEYYKCDYSDGVDISMYKNVPVPTSYMVAHSDFDFIGNYDEGVQAGLLHVADHHISPGKKQWTWGNGDFGRTWDKNLTDEDGPYIELMTGVYTDNQPDFTWLKPHEEKTFVQYFMPYKGVGRISNATKDIVIGLNTADESNAILKLYSTGVYDNALIKVTANDKVIYEKIVNLSPNNFFVDTFNPLNYAENCRVTVYDQQNVNLASYQVYKKTNEPIPEPAKALLQPVELKSNEDLFLAGQHLEQYRHATFEAKEYYLEGLRRDPTDIRINNAIGLLELKAGNFEKSITHFKTAIEKQTWRNPNPYSGECYYNLGLAYEFCGENDNAYDAFFKATWSYETQGVGFYHLACLASKKGEFIKAIEFCDKSIINNYHNMKVRSLKAALLRKTGVDNTAFLKESYMIDPLYMGIHFEIALKNNKTAQFKTQMRKPAFNYLKLSLEYMNAGFYEDCLHILSLCEDVNPLLSYYSGYASLKNGNASDAKGHFLHAEQLAEDHCFPSYIEEIMILNQAIFVLGSAAKAEYYLGNIFYDKKEYQKAVVHWESAVELNHDFAMAHRNLSIAYFNKQNNGQKAFEAINTACNLDSINTRFLLERDQISAKLHHSTRDRLKALEAHADILNKRDALYLAYISLLNAEGQYDAALKCISNHIFHPWEGGEGKVAQEYKYSLTEIAKREMDLVQYQSAITLLEKTLYYPENLGEGKLPNVPDNATHYLLGKCYQALCQNDKAELYFKLATLGDPTPRKVLYYNDQSSDYIYYQGLAFHELGNETKAKKSFHQLISFAERHIFDAVSYDFFAVSLPELGVYKDNLQQNNTEYCNHLMNLGQSGLREIKTA